MCARENHDTLSSTVKFNTSAATYERFTAPCILCFFSRMSFLTGIFHPHGEVAVELRSHTTR